LEWRRFTVETASSRRPPSPLLPSLVFQLAVTAIYPIFIQPLFNKFTALPEGPIREKVSALSKRLHFPLKHLYEIDGSKRSGHSNAFVVSSSFDASFLRAEVLMMFFHLLATSTGSLGRSTSSSTTPSSRRARPRRLRPFLVSFLSLSLPLLDVSLLFTAC